MREPHWALTLSGPGLSWGLWLLVSCGIESIVPFETHFWNGQSVPCFLPVSPCPQPLPLHPVAAMPYPLPSVLPHPSSETSFPDCHRHTDRQTDRQTVAYSSIAHALAWCSPWGVGGCLKLLLTAPSQHSVHLGASWPAQSRVPLGEGGSTGARGLP